MYKKEVILKKKSKENAGSEILGVIAYDAIKKFEEKKY